MEGFGWIASIILGAIAGWIAEKIMKTDTGLLMNIIVGIVGIFPFDIPLIKTFILIDILRHRWHGHAHAVLGARHRLGFGSACHDARVPNARQKKWRPI